MPLSIGEKLGPYEILAPLGAGGMGEVYRARDTKLKREVALKVLPASFAGDPGRLDRFQREAEVLASLNHPHIAQIYGVEDGALVMELVEGETLSSRLPIDTALHYAHQIAEGLEYAHERGVIHRDLKPTNIKVTPEGTVKLLDFGLAKAIEDPAASRDDPEHSPTLTLGVTRVGVILGTAAYMSPEQASGRNADRRADIWSFGAVLYEMLAGKRAFAGESVSDTLATVLKLDPDWSALPADTPASIRRLIQRCLTKDRKQRLQAIGEARIALESPVVEDAVPSVGTFARLLPWIAATALFAAVTCFMLWRWLRSAAAEPRAVLRVTVTLPVQSDTPDIIALSRDGSRLAFVGRERQIYLKMMDQFEARPIPGTEGSATCCLAFSPEGQWISYISGGSPNLRLVKVAVSGGPPQTLTDLKESSGQTWGPDGNILFTKEGDALMRISSSGGTPETLAAPDTKRGEWGYFYPRLVPGGQDVLVGVGVAAGTKRVLQIAAMNLQTREKKILLESGGVPAQYLPSNPGSLHGHIVYFDSGTRRLMAVPFDVKRSKAEGSPAPVLDDLLGTPFPQFTISDSGTLAYVPSGAGSESLSTLVWVDRTGTEQALPAPPRAFRAFQLSPDGEHIAFEIQGDRSNDLWNYDIARGTFARLTTDGNNIGPVWTPDGKRLIYSFNGPQNWELRSLAADNSGSPSVLWSGVGVDDYRTSTVSPDGKTLVVHLDSFANGTTFFMLPLGESPSRDSRPQPFLKSSFLMGDLRFSPDGRYVSYQSLESGHSEIYVAPYPGPGGRLPISTGGGSAARWSRSGRELFYRSSEGLNWQHAPGRMMVVDIQTTPTIRVGKPQSLFEKRDDLLGFDLAPDGRRFLMLKSQAAEQGSTVQLNLVVNWFDDLRRRVPVGK
jgi:eukaryotic-like serine/threonine-protein kinase